MVMHLRCRSHTALSMVAVVLLYQCQIVSTQVTDCPIGREPYNMMGRNQGGRPVFEGCRLCDSSTFSNQQGPEPCEDVRRGYRSDGGRSDCKGGINEHICAVGSYSDGTYCQSDTSLSFHTCEICDFATTTDGNGNYYEPTCNIDCNTHGSYWEIGKCHECSAGTHADNEVGRGSCDECQPGTVQYLTGQRHCDSCYGGTYQDESGATSCKPCEGGKTSLGGATQCFCPAGTKKVSETCVSCPSGTYQDETDQTSCTSCAEGTTHFTEGQTSQDSCNSVDGCPAGETPCCYKQVEGTADWKPSACKMCNKGKYSDTTDFSECEPCAAGTFQDEKGQSSCRDCPAGTFQGSQGKSSCSLQGGENRDWECRQGWTREIDRCVPCLAGTEYGSLTIGDETRNVCRRCAVGTFKSIDMSPDDRCEGCPIGTYSETTGATRCTDCPAGQSTGSRNSASIDACTCGGVARRPVSAPPLLAESQSAVDFYASSGGLGHCMYENCP